MKNLLAERKRKLSNLVPQEAESLPCRAVWHIPLLIYNMILSLKGWEAADGAQTLTANHCTASIKCYFCPALLSVPLTRHSTGTADKKRDSCDSAFFYWEKIFLILSRTDAKLLSERRSSPDPEKLLEWFKGRTGSRSEGEAVTTVKGRAGGQRDTKSS